MSDIQLAYHILNNIDVQNVNKAFLYINDCNTFLNSSLFLDISPCLPTHCAKDFEQDEDSSPVQLAL